jgi:hypothetical protein
MHFVFSILLAHEQYACTQHHARAAACYSASFACRGCWVRNVGPAQHFAPLRGLIGPNWLWREKQRVFKTRADALYRYGPFAAVAAQYAMNITACITTAG